MKSNSFSHGVSTLTVDFSNRTFSNKEKNVYRGSFGGKNVGTYDSSSNTDKLAVFLILCSMFSMVLGVLYFLRRVGILGVFLLISSNLESRASSNVDSRFLTLVNLIRKCEGNKYYGVKSVKVRSEAHAHQVCLNTIVNNYRRWNSSDKKSHFLIFLANRYCPKSVDPVGNKNWIKNITVLAKQANLKF